MHIAMAVGERWDFFLFCDTFQHKLLGKFQTLTMLFMNPAEMARRLFALQLIPEYGRAALNEPIIKWLEQVEMICKLADEESVERILSLRLTGRALAVYRQLSKDQRADIKEIKRALTTAFAIDAFMAFEQFAMWRLCNGRTVDEFLAALERLAHKVEERPPEK